MQNNLKVARAHRALCWLYVVLTLAMAALSIFLFSSASGAPPRIASSSLYALLLFAGLCALHHFVAKGAKGNAEWARITSMLIAAAMLFGFPIGTIIGVYLLILTASWNPKNPQAHGPA